MVIEPSHLESVSDVARTQFAAWRRLADISRQARAKDGARRTQLTNRYRSARQLEPGDYVMVKDPKLSKKNAGHAPGRRPLSGPYRVTKIEGQKADLEHCRGGLPVSGEYFENIVRIRPETFGIEGLAGESGDVASSSGQRRTPAQMFRDAAAGVPWQADPGPDAKPRLKAKL